MTEYIDIPYLLNFSLGDISNEEGIRQKKEEIKSRFELTDKKTIRFKDRVFKREEAISLLNKLLENAPSYFIIEEVLGLKIFMKTGYFLNVDFGRLHTLEEKQKEVLKPFINYACFLFGSKLINEYDDITPDELFNLPLFISEINVLGTDYIDEAKKMIDQEWKNKLITVQNQYLAEKPERMSVSVSAIHSMIKWTDIDQNEHIAKYTKPYDAGDKAFEDCLIKIVRYFIDSVNGKVSLYPKATLKHIIKLIDVICLKKPFEFPYYNKLKNKITRLLIDKKELDIKFVVFGLIIITFLIGMALSNL